MTTASPDSLVALALLLGAELALLWRGQRRLFWATASAAHSHVVAYVLAAPGTALHEASHYLACVALGVPVGRVRLFWPTRTPAGDVILGSVPHAPTGPARRALIAIAPLVLVPALLMVATALLLGPDALGRLPDAIGEVPAWRAALWIYLSLSCGQAVFPSPGDRVGAVGAVFLLALGIAVVGGTVLLAGAAGLHDVLAALTGVLAIPALAAAVSLIGLAVLGRVTRGR